MTLKLCFVNLLKMRAFNPFQASEISEGYAHGARHCETQATDFLEVTLTRKKKS